LRDQVKKPISHLGGLETENEAKEERKEVPQRRNTLGRRLHLP
jgi:hypothetical protein